MATKSNKNVKSRKLNNKKIAKLLIPLIAIVLFIYIIYKVISLIIVPTDIYMIENGTIYNEEDAVRLCNKR